jgi:hypothetical protein
MRSGQRSSCGVGANPAWVAFNAIMVEVGLDALKADARSRQGYTRRAGDVLYPPCDGCHLQFNPGVAPAQ